MPLCAACHAKSTGRVFLHIWSTHRTLVRGKGSLPLDAVGECDRCGRAIAGKKWG